MKNQKTTGELIKSVKDANKAHFSKQEERNRVDSDHLKAQLYTEKAQNSNSVPYELYKKEIQDITEATKKAREKDLQNTKEREASNEELFESLNQKNKDSAQTLTNSHIKEIHNLEDSVKNLSGYNRTLEKQKAAESAKWTQDNETAVRNREHHLSDSYEQTIDKLKQEGDDKDDRYSKRTNEIIQKNTDKAAERQAQLMIDHNLDTKIMKSGFESQIDQMEKGRKQDQQRSEELLHRINLEHNESMTRALEDRAAQQQEESAQTAKSYQSQIDSLQKALKEQRTTQDPSMGSSGIERSIRNGLVAEYEKSLKADIDRNQTATENLRERLMTDLQKAQAESEDKTTAFQQQSSKELNLERNQFLNTLQESESQNSTKLRESESSHEKEKQNIYQKFNNAMEQQRRQLDNAYGATLNETENKLLNARQESDFNLKLLLRSFNTKQNEIIREYEKKLADQKNDSDFQIENLSFQSKIDYRDLEKKMKQELESQAKSYEQRMAQMEAQNKEREHNMEINYQNELDRTKRSYEQLGKKKS